MRLRAVLISVGVAGAVLANALPARAADPTCAFPDTAWASRDPKALGLDAAKLQDALDFATAHSSETVLVIRRGCLAAASRLDPITSELQLDGWSMTKSVTALLVGRAVTLGKLDIDAPIGNLFPEADTKHAQITPRNLLTMSSGLRLHWTRDFNGTSLMPDRVRDALSLPFVHRRGTHWQYHQSPVSLLGEVVTRAVGRDLQTFAQAELFGPIGIPRDAWTWDRDRAGHTEAWAHLKMRSSDWARLGYLVLRRGNWSGTQLVSKAYLKQMLTPSAPNHAYGFLTWLNGRDSYVMPSVNGHDAGKGWIVPKAPKDSIIFAGQDEQRTYVVPSLDLIVVRLGQKGSREADMRVSFWTARAGELDNELMRRIQLAVTDTKIKDPGPYEGSDFVMPSTSESSWHGSVQNPEQVLAGVGAGPSAPKGCTPAGCE